MLKPHFAPIEQYAESKQLRQGPWTDLYALGAVITFLLDGSPPPASTARAITTSGGRALAKRRVPNVSPRFLAAIDWALAVRPQDRPQSVAALRSALGGGAPNPMRRSRRRALPVIVRGTSRLLRPLGAAAAVVLAVATGVVLWSRAPGEAAATAPLLAAASPTAQRLDPPAPARPVCRGGARPCTHPGDRAAGVVVCPWAGAGSAVGAATAGRAAGRRRHQGGRRHSEGALADEREVGPQAQNRGHERGRARADRAMCRQQFLHADPFASERLCDEPRHRARSECAPLRQAARSQRD